MTIYNSNEIQTLVGKTLERVELDDGQAAFATMDGELYVIFPMFGATQDGPDTVDGELADVIGSPVTSASYDVYSFTYIVETEQGEVRLICPGPRTGFRREQ